jgi:hypothetical protein
MKVGDSFAVTLGVTDKPSRTKTAIQRVGDCISQYMYKHGKKVGKKYTLRSVSDIEIRIWRTL